MVVLCFFVLFFFKQKTSYEMRISDWSSDVCSSDLLNALVLAQHIRHFVGIVFVHLASEGADKQLASVGRRMLGLFRDQQPGGSLGFSGHEQGGRVGRRRYCSGTIAL